MKTTRIYQTIEDRNNPDDVESSGPYLCSNDKAWLGRGYYFWEQFMENAHWWGSTAYPNGYIICQASYAHDNVLCWDLTSIDGILEFRTAIDLMSDAGIDVRTVEVYVPRVIEFLKEIKQFKWNAIKADPKNARKEISEYTLRAKFTHNHPAYIDLCPTVQICFCNKNDINLSEYKIIYPREYVDGYLV